MSRWRHEPPLVDYGRGMTFPGSWYGSEPYEPDGWWRADPDEQESDESIAYRKAHGYLESEAA